MVFRWAEVKEAPKEVVKRRGHGSSQGSGQRSGQRNSQTSAKEEAAKEAAKEAAAANNKRIYAKKAWIERNKPKLKR